MRGADVLAMPSLWPEPFGLVGVEAACLGLPTVGYAMGAIPEWLVAGETGELAPANPPTAEGLAAALVRALASADHLQHLRLGAWEGSRRRTMHHHVEALEDIFRTAAAG
jgi:glycosyltransferase involved in cell wall biosynthesis